MNFWDIAVSFCASALMGMGVGGGGILTVYLTVFRDVLQSTAQGINLLSYASAALCAAPVHIKKRKINTRKVAFMGFCSATGGVLGSLAALKINGEVLKTAFSLFIIALGVYGIVKCINKEK